MDLFSLFQAQIPTTANKLLIAFSGGLDSTALLSLVKKLREKRPHLSLRAIHIHHGLSPNADACASFNAIVHFHFDSFNNKWNGKLFTELLAMSRPSIRIRA